MIEFGIKEKTRSLNEAFRGDWRPRAAAAKRQRTKAMQACPKWPGGPLLVVRLTRVSPRTLDFGNLAGALKHVQDGVASRLKVDDASPLVEWRFEQATGDAEVVVQIWKAGEAVPALPVGRPVEKRRGKTLAKVEADAGKRLHVVREPGNGRRLAPRPAYVAPRSHVCGKNGCRKHRPCEVHDVGPAVDAAKQAEETFAPAPLPACGAAGCMGCDRCEVAT